MSPEYARHQLGRTAEQLAEQFLQERGFQTITRNLRTPFGEIDLICRRQRLLVFVEVRCRSQAAFMHPVESLTYAKLQRFRRSAQFYLRQHGRSQPYSAMRFDAICVTGKANPTVEHFEDIVAVAEF